CLLHLACRLPRAAVSAYTALFRSRQIEGRVAGVPFDQLAVSTPALGATGGADEQVKLPIQLPQHLEGTQPQSAGRQGQTAVPGGIAVAIVEFATAQADGRVGLQRPVRTPLHSQLQSRGAGLTDVDVLP